MLNQICLCAQIKSLDNLRYTPAGLPVLTMWLTHKSWQTELQQQYLAKVEIQAKALGDLAENWSYLPGNMVEVSGFLSQKGIYHSRPVLHIQQIREYKG